MASLFKSARLETRRDDGSCRTSCLVALVLASTTIAADPAQDVPLVVKPNAFPTLVNPNYTGETAERWRYVDGAGEIGVISSVTQAFCSDCNRARLSTEGKLFLCLFASQGHDLRALLRGGFADDQIAAAVGHIWQARTDHYSELRAAMPADASPSDGTPKRVEMSYIGG